MDYVEAPLLQGRLSTINALSACGGICFLALHHSFIAFFYFLEEAGVHDPLSEVDIYALHYINIPRVNQQIIFFQNAWNNHRMRTTRGLTPLQMFIQHAIEEDGFKLINSLHNYRH